ncbi:hypothetical protein [Nitratireductor basaltis]|uniref:Uncharacterized protein n=1 Tax=Nitratireductor basaltis TaxID=472175 RepID=A0A084UBP2_9HYPH|nr:hypothetical protein [Nitratireductor basaltis]KFB10378.1 hypothetical protein EL18_01409 [Nitratireductor basaltis]
MTTLDEVIDQLNSTEPAPAFEIGRIKPLAWVDTPDGPIAAMPFAVYTVDRDDLGWWWTCTTDAEQRFPCESEEDGKQKAWEHWRRMAALVLEPAPKATEETAARLIAAVEGELDGLAITTAQARTLLEAAQGGHK